MAEFFVLSTNHQLNPMDKSYQFLRSEEGDDLKIFKVRRDYYINNRNQHSFQVAVLEGLDAANVMAITEDDEVIMVKQYRFGIGEETLELPGGLVESSEESLEGVKRELLEETGYEAADWEYIGAVQSNPVFMSSLIHQYVARGVKKIADNPPLDMEENIEVVKVPIGALRDLILERKIQHPHALTVLMQYLWLNGY